MTSWTPKRIEMLKTLWNQGFSAAEIATQFGDLTRNAVIGKVHREWLAGRNPGSINRIPRCTRRRHKSKIAALAEIVTPIEIVTAPLQRREIPTPIIVASELDVHPILTLKLRSCRWPIGDPKEPDFRFCGCSALPGRPYCAEHMAIAYIPIRPRKRPHKSGLNAKIAS